MSLETLKASHGCKATNCNGTGRVIMQGGTSRCCHFCHGTGIDLTAIAAHIEALEAEIVILRGAIESDSMPQLTAAARLGRAYRAAERVEIRFGPVLLEQGVRCADVERLATQHQQSESK